MFWRVKAAKERATYPISASLGQGRARPIEGRGPGAEHLRLSERAGDKGRRRCRSALHLLLCPVRRLGGVPGLGARRGDRPGPAAQRPVPAAARRCIGGAARRASSPPPSGCVDAVLNAVGMQRARARSICAAARAASAGPVGGLIGQRAVDHARRCPMFARLDAGRRADRRVDRRLRPVRAVASRRRHEGAAEARSLNGVYRRPARRPRRRAAVHAHPAARPQRAAAAQRPDASAWCCWACASGC